MPNFNVQDDTGLVDGANAYISVDFFKAYHDDRGNDYSALDTDAKVQFGIVKATDYVDRVNRYKGETLNTRSDGQQTQFPRADLVDRNGDDVTGIPWELQAAVAEYTLKGMTQDLFVDVTVGAGGSLIASTSDKVGEISSSVTYANPDFQWIDPKFPVADRLLQDFVRTRGKLMRA